MDKLVQKQDGEAIYKKSPLKWAGSKWRIIDKVQAEIAGDRLADIFCGSLTVAINSPASYIYANDINYDLINLFTIIKNDHTSLLELSKEMFAHDGKEYYLEVRNSLHNLKGLYKAAAFLYINKFCFNGLCRYNSKGLFNVPWGKRSGVAVPESEILYYNKILNEKDIILSNNRYEGALEFLDTQNKMTVYMDPPYSPLTLNGFVGYNSGGFGTSDHEHLVRWAENTFHKVVISNHDNEHTRNLYKNSSRIVNITSRHNVAGSSSDRREIKELIAIYNR